MKKTFCLILLAVFLPISCSKDTPTEPGVEPTVLSTSIADGATDVKIDLGSITLRYSTPIVLSDAASISMNGISLATETANTTLTISFGTLDYETEYTLQISGGAVINKKDQTIAKAFSLKFSTEKQIVPPGPPYNPTEPGDYSQNLVTANPIANATTLYKYLLSIYGTNTLSGAMAKVNWNTTEAQWIHTWTDKWPAVAHFDYIHLPFSPSNWIDYSDITPVKEWWDAKGLVGLCWHWLVPTYEGSTEYTYVPDETTWKASEILKEGTWENTQAKADLDRISEYLLLLQAENIPVIWRPLHEAAGNIYTQWHSGAWFWWGDGGADIFKQLWIYMFDYFKEKGVRNLIWVWTTQTSTIDDTDYYFYPGDNYVDIVGKDIYNNTNPTDIFNQFYTVTHMTSHKMATLSENGGDSDMDAQWNAGAKWLFFMPWYDNDNDLSEDYPHTFATISWWKDSFKNSAVLDRSKIPSDLFPEWTSK